MNVPPQHKKNIFFICILWLIMSSCNTPNSEKAVGGYSFVDSLIEHYKNTSFQRPDIVKQNLLKLRQTTNDSIDYYKLTQFISYACFQNNQPDSAFLLNDKVIRFCKKQSPNLAGLSELETYAYFHRSQFFRIKNQLDSTSFYLKQAYSIANHTKKHKELVNICINIAYNYSLQGNYSLAVFFYKKAEDAADSLHLHNEVYSSIHTGLAKVYLDLNNFKLSDYYLKLAEKNYKKMSPDKQYVFASIKANYLYIIKDYKKSLEWNIRANNVTSKFKLNTYRGITECNLGENYLLLNQLDSAKSYLDKANASFFKTGLNEDYSFYINCLYAELALQKNDLESAHRLLFKHYDLSKVKPQYIYLYNRKLESYYQKKGDFRNAYFYSAKADTLNESLRKEIISNAILEIDTRYSKDTSLLKENLIVSKSKAEVQKSRFVSIIYLSLLFAGIIIIGIFICSSRKKRELKLKKQLITITKLRMENIRNRISPHVLFNMLNAVMPTVKQDDNLVHLFRLLIQSLRNNLVASEKIAVSLEDEIEFVKNYIEFHKKANRKKIDIYWNIAQEIPFETLIPSMIIQIPIENAIKYAFKEEQEDAYININVSTDNHFLYIIIEDNGIGYNPGNHVGDKNSTGTGLKVIFQTIQLLNHKNQENIFFNIEDMKNLLPDLHGTRVTIITPLKYNFEL